MSVKVLNEESRASGVNNLKHMKDGDLAVSNGYLSAATLPAISSTRAHRQIAFLHPVGDQALQYGLRDRRTYTSTGHSHSCCQYSTKPMVSSSDNRSAAAPNKARAASRISTVTRNRIKMRT